MPKRRYTKRKYKSRSLKNSKLYNSRYKRGQGSGSNFIVRFFFILLFFGLISGVFYFLFLSPFFNVQSIVFFDEKGALVESSELNQSVESYIDERQSVVLPNESIFLINKDLLKTKLLQDYPIYHDVTIKKKYPEQLRLNLIERKPWGIWCVENCILFDDEGVAYAKINSELETNSILKFKENKYVYIYDDGQTQEVKFDQLARIDDIEKFKTSIPLKMVNFTNELVTMLNNRLGIEVKDVYVPEKYGKEVVLLTADGYKLITTTFEYKPTTVVDILRTLYSESSFPVDNLSYLDLRVKGRAITCERGKSCAYLDRGEKIPEGLGEEVMVENDDVVEVD